MRSDFSVEEFGMVTREYLSLSTRGFEFGVRPIGSIVLVVFYTFIAVLFF